MMDIGKALSGCGEQGKKKANKPRKDEGIGQSKI
jgi:hypothetical protein